MGMAASQARYLELTARKTNVEYEGQQVNQQRTDLANQSAGMFSQLMALNVPTPPSSSEYTTISYNYTDGNNTETIDSMVPLPATDPDYNYTVTHSHTQDTYTGVQKVNTNPQVTEESGVYWIGNKSFKTSVYNATTDATAVAQIAADNPSSTFYTDWNNGAGTADIFSYKSGGVTYYACDTDLNACATGAASTLNTYYAADLPKKISTTEKAYISTDSTGRLSSIELQSTPSTEFNLNATSKTDDNAYNDAMNEYTYQQQLYENSVQSINAKTKIIEEEDRTLELRLKQLDTEQDALQTEMEAVKKVIDKNIEQTFKTFS